jgi:aryl-alcohol dehydrogenase-like predicted oxidoreductase
MRLGIGTAQFGMRYGISNINGKTSLQEAEKIVYLAKINHIDCIDTAIAYGDSESILGRLGIKDFKLITKIPPVNKANGKVDRQIADMVSESLERLGLSKLFGMLADDSSQLLTENGDKLYESMRRLKKLGLVDKIGLSAYSSADITNLINRYEFLLQLKSVSMEEIFFLS